MRTGAELTDIGKVDRIFLGAITTSGLLVYIATGNDYYPDDKATVIIRANIGFGPASRLTGPGNDGAAPLQLDGLPTGFWNARAARLRYSKGLDLFFVDGARAVGMHRSTTM